MSEDYKAQLAALTARVEALEATQHTHPGQPEAPPAAPAPAGSLVERLRAYSWRRPLQCPTPATIAECGGPCEQAFHFCDCGLLEQLNPELKVPAPAGSLVEPAEGLLDKSDAADAARFRWIISGNGYFVPDPDPYSRDPVGLDQTRQVVDEMMAKSNTAQQLSLKKSLSQEVLRHG